MNHTLENMLIEAEGRYLSPEESRQLLKYAASLELRLAAMTALEKIEPKIVDEVLAIVWQRHPEFERAHHQAKERCRRDVTLVLRYCAQAMLREDEQFLQDKMLHWLHTILHSFHFGKVIETTYRALPQRVEANLSAQYHQLLAPYLTLTMETLTRDR